MSYVVLVLSILGEASLLGMIIGGGVMAWRVSTQSGWGQLLRELCLSISIFLSGSALWWDLTHDVQYPIDLRIVLTFVLLIAGNVGYALISNDLRARYKGLRSAKHELNNYKHMIQGLKDALDFLQDDKSRLIEENVLLRRELGR